MEKRDRSSNFTDTDRELLMRIVADKYFNVIENKKTDGITLKKKNEAWENVAVTFNSVTTNEQRTAIQLKNAYNNIKRKLKKGNVDEKVATYKTGGGAPLISELNESNVRLLSLLKPQIEPLENHFDTSDYFDENHSGAKEAKAEDMAFEVIAPTPTYTDETPMSKKFTAIASTSYREDNNAVSKKKKRRLVNIYDIIEEYTKVKYKKQDEMSKKHQIEIDVLLLKKKKQEILNLQEEERLQQEKLKRQQEELKQAQEILKLKIEEEKLKTEQEKLKIEVELKVIELSLKRKELNQL